MTGFITFLQKWIRIETNCIDSYEYNNGHHTKKRILVTNLYWGESLISNSIITLYD